MSNAYAGRHRQRLLHWMDRAGRARPPSQWLLGLGLLAVLLLSLALAEVLRRDRERALSQQQERNGLLARLFEDQVSRDLDGAATALATLSLSLRNGATVSTELLTQTLRHQRTLRELLITDLQGKVLAASRSEAVGQRVPEERLRPLPSGEQVVLGVWTPGRFLTDALADVLPPKLGYLPLLLRGERQGEPILMVATLHTEAWAVAMRSTLGSEGEQAALVHFDGQLLAHSHRAAPGSVWLDRLEFLSDSPQPFGTQLGLGLESRDPALLAWRQAGNRPLALIVERDRAAVLTSWWSASRPQLLGAGLMPLLLGGTVVTGWYRLRRREQHQARIAQSQRLIARRESELAHVVGNLRELLFRTDRDTRLRFISASSQTLFGQAPEALLGQSFLDLVRQSERRQARQLFNLEPAAAPACARLVLQTQDARERHFDVTVVPLMDEHGGVGFAGGAIEVTEQEQERARLEAEANFYARLVELNPLPTSLIDDQGCYLQVNQAWEAFMGHSREQVLGRPAASLQTADEARRHEALDGELRAQGGGRRYECSYVGADGQRHDLLVTKVRLSAQLGRPAAILSTVMDVSELRATERAAERKLAQAHEARGASQAFFQSVGRDLLQPLGELQEALVRASGRRRDAKALADMAAAAQRLQANVGDLLALAQRDLGTHPQGQSVTGVDLGALLQQAVQAQQAAWPDCSFELQLPRMLPAWPGNEVLLSRLMQRLCGLAAQGTGHSPRVLLDLRMEARGTPCLTLSSRGGACPPPPQLAQDEWNLCQRLTHALGADMTQEELADGGWRIQVHWAPSPNNPPS
ncbi:PAS domain S-box-containing protein [Inhella inkyongensis]|uniref:PAS domain S-box-containing protein n=1 Tax=Inhella inkyongensis TaxID=392593 RepID=A0A840S889_9BURK|nr:PAS domain-containing protein [Inhella inkyongensis]MBB5205014.1 PAS domain S-box-containing protein [Inhella inkyongensis]